MIKFEDLSNEKNKNAYKYFTEQLMKEKKKCTVFIAINKIPKFYNYLVHNNVSVEEVFQKIQFQNKEEYLFVYFNPLKLQMMERIVLQAFDEVDVQSLNRNYFFDYIDLMIFSAYFYVKDLGFISQKGGKTMMRNQILATIQKINDKEVNQVEIINDTIAALNYYMNFAETATIEDLSIEQDKNMTKKNILLGLDSLLTFFSEKLAELKGWFNVVETYDQPTMDTKDVLNWREIDDKAKETQLDLTTERILQLYDYYNDKNDRNTPLAIYYNKLLHPTINVTTVLEGGKPTEKIEDRNRQQDPVETVTLKLFDPEGGPAFAPRLPSKLAPAVQFLNVWRYIYRENKNSEKIETDFINPESEKYKVQLQINNRRDKFQIKNIIKQTLVEAWQPAKGQQANGTKYVNLSESIQKKVLQVNPKTNFEGDYRVERKIGYTDHPPDNLIITCTASKTVYFENDYELLGLHDIEMFQFNNNNTVNHQYTLVAFILYSQATGTKSNSGHYTACVRRLDDWYFVNDSRVFKIENWNLNEGTFSYNGGNDKKFNIRQMFYEKVNEGSQLLTKKPIGIENTTGVACYVNASVQCFMTLNGISNIAEGRKNKELVSTPRASKSSSDSSNKTTPPSSGNRNNKKSSTPRTVKAAKKTNNNENLIFRVVHHGENLEYIYLSASEKPFIVVGKFEVYDEYDYGEEKYEVVARVNDEIVLKKVVQQKTKKRKKTTEKKIANKTKENKRKRRKEEQAKLLARFNKLRNKKLYSLENEINLTLKF